VLTADAASAGELDEAYERLHATGPEFEGYLSNHGPMASEALVQMGLARQVHRWLDGYTDRLEPRPRGGTRIRPPDVADALGDGRRLGDWLDYFENEVTERAWREVLIEWWPRLLPGSLASATHALIRTGHAIRALQAAETPPRVAELGQALGYWAARYQPVPGVAPLSGRLAPADALAAVPRVSPQSGGVAERIPRLADTAGWSEASAALRPPVEPEQVPAALAALTDAAVLRYLTHGHGDPVLLVHTATAPNAALQVIRELPTDQWLPTHAAVWRAAAALTAGFAPPDPWTGPAPAPAESAEQAAQAALESGDEHVIKFTETALRAEARGVLDARTAAAHALDIMDL
jgi:hypothetical protein